MEKKQCLFFLIFLFFSLCSYAESDFVELLPDIPYPEVTPDNYNKICKKNINSYISRLTHLEEIADDFDLGIYSESEVKKKIQQLKVSRLDWKYLQEYKKALLDVSNNEYNIPPFDENDFHNEDKSWLRKFKYVIVIEKSVTGSTISSMRVYTDGFLTFKSNVSTGRGILEFKRFNPKCDNYPYNFYFSDTPNGYFTFNKLFLTKKTKEWGVELSNVMFFDLKKGLALHSFADASHKKVLFSGSGGCVRLDDSTAQSLFDAILKTAGAQTPIINKDGTVNVDAKGNIRSTQREGNNEKIDDYKTYSALLIIQDMPVIKSEKVSSVKIEKFVNSKFVFKEYSEKKEECPIIFDCLKRKVQSVLSNNNENSLMQDN